MSSSFEEEHLYLHANDTCRWQQARRLWSNLALIFEKIVSFGVTLLAFRPQTKLQVITPSSERTIDTWAVRISSGITKYLVANCIGDIESEERQGRVNGETSRGETTGVMTPVVNIRRPTVDWGVNLQRSVVCLRVYTCSPINAYTCIYTCTCKTHTRTRKLS